jgi:hypothetical protein
MTPEEQHYFSLGVFSSSVCLALSDEDFFPEGNRRNMICRARDYLAYSKASLEEFAGLTGENASLMNNPAVVVRQVNELTDLLGADIVFDSGFADKLGQYAEVLEAVMKGKKYSLSRIAPVKDFFRNLHDGLSYKRA